MNSLSLYPKPSLPVEILYYVVAHMLCDKPDFSTISSFSLASRQFRIIAFRQFFSLLWCTTKSQWTSYCRIPGVTSWARTLECTSTSLYLRTEDLARFHSLRRISIDFASEGLGTHHDSFQRIVPCLPPQVALLELLFLPSITTHLLSLIAARCSLLKTLVLRCSDRLLPECCWNCYDEAGSCTIHSPIPEHYCDAQALVNAFGAALAPLRKLKHLHLGIFLSDSDLFYEHLDHAGDFRFPPTLDTVKPYPPDQCEQCKAVAYDVRQTELIAAAIIASHLPCLGSITWSTWFAEKEPGDSANDQSTTIWVTQAEDGIAARRVPW